MMWWRWRGMRRVCRWMMWWFWLRRRLLSWVVMGRCGFPGSWRPASVRKGRVLGFVRQRGRVHSRRSRSPRKQRAEIGPVERSPTVRGVAAFRRLRRGRLMACRIRVLGMWGLARSICTQANGRRWILPRRRRVSEERIRPLTVAHGWRGSRMPRRSIRYRDRWTRPSGRSVRNR